MPYKNPKDKLSYQKQYNQSKSDEQKQKDLARQRTRYANSAKKRNKKQSSNMSWKEANPDKVALYQRRAWQKRNLELKLSRLALESLGLKIVITKIA